MKPKLFALAVCCTLLLFTACSDDKSSSGSSGSSSSSSSSSSDNGNGSGDKSDKDLTPDADSKSEPAERGFKESTQAEAGKLDGKEFAIGTRYNGGDRVKVSNLGFSYRVPDGALSEMPAGSGAIQVGEIGSNLLTLIVARTGVTEAEARDMISKPFDLGNGSELAPVGEISKKGDCLARAMSNTAVTGYIQMLIGKSAGVAVMTIGLPGSEAQCKSYSSKVLDSIEFAAPAGEKERLQHEAGLKGKVIKVFTYKGSTPNSGSNWSRETHKHWHLGSDHSYEYIYRLTTASSSDVHNQADDHHDNHAGTWSIELTMALPMLVCRTNDGRFITYTLDVVKGYLNIDGQEATLGPSDRKR
ncbi:MAG: hypothetical protein IT464_03550 [Planctomycetes bacterium]|nr:hypothetical protein [Planctomycetota bacterium]